MTFHARPHEAVDRRIGRPAAGRGSIAGRSAAASPRIDPVLDRAIALPSTMPINIPP
jgi:hypothetical protein